MGRINAWHMAFNLSLDRPIVGGGFEIYNRVSFARWAPDPEDLHAAHSIYFQCLGVHGWVGLGLYLLLAYLTWRRGSWIVRQARTLPDFKWVADLATMIQVSMVGFATGGAFLSLLYYDVPYYLLAIMVVAGELIAKAMKEQALAKKNLAATPASLHPAVASSL
jgi:probable O-glycosylation ligase (exosortase A-associated)